MLIRLPPELSWIVTGTGLDLTDPHATSLFLHEWFHYVHNISTVSGVYAFASMVHLWAHFRSTLDESGKSVASRPLQGDAPKAVSRTRAHYMGARRAHENLGVLKESRSDFDLLGTTLQSSPLVTHVPSDQAECATTVVCRLKVSTDATVVDAKLGTAEILEGIASMLEARYLLAHKVLPSPRQITPYQLLGKLARHVVADIEDDHAIGCALASLQDPDPPRALMDILGAVQAVPPQDRSSTIATLMQEQLARNDHLLERLFKQTEDLFPLDEPMGAATKEIIATMRTSIRLRRSAPLFELMLLDQANAESPENHSQRLGRIVADVSCPRIFVTRSGPEDVVARDDIVRWTNPATASQDIDFGLQKLHAAFHYLRLHVAEAGFRETATSSDRKCPFYTTCSYDLRTDQPHLCATKPWESFQIPVEPQDACWYRAAVRATRPPLDAFT